MKRKYFLAVVICMLSFNIGCKHCYKHITVYPPPEVLGYTK